MPKHENLHLIYVAENIVLNIFLERPTRDVIVRPNYNEHFSSKPNEIKTLDIRVKEQLDTNNPENIIQNVVEEIPPWTYQT